MSVTLLDTITPDEIEETPPLSGRVNLDELIAQLFKVQNRRDRYHSYKEHRNHKKHYKSQSRRYHRRYRYRHRYSDTLDTLDLSDSKSNHERRRKVPFRHSEDKKLFLSIA